MTVVPSKTKSNTRTDKSKARQKLRESRQYDPLAHVEEDTQRSRGRASGETKEVYRERVKLYEEFLTQEGLRPTEFSFQERSPAPTLEELKRFIRWYIASTKGRIDDTPTMRTVLIRAQELVPGFYLVTGNHIPSEDTEELYSWIQNDLTKDKVINDIRKGKYNFTKRDFIRVMTSFWVLDNPVFLHGRHKIQIPFITKIYLFSGARIGAFLPAAKHKKERGLRYKHIQLVLFRTRGKAPWKLGWRLDQQWVKNNRNSTYTVFSLAIWEHEKPLFSAANELLALAFLDHALFGYDTPEELFEQRIPEGDNELPLRWRDEALERCIVRNISGNTVTEDPLTKESFSPLFRQVANNAGYFVTPTIHAMRRSLGKQINKHYSSAMVAQVLTQKDDNVYGRDYVAHCSSISTVDEALEEEEDTTHIDYFQSYAQFHETGLPCKLLAIHEENVEQDPELMQLKMRISDLKGKGEDSGLLLELRSEYGVAKARLRASALQQYQTAWVQEQRDWKILTRGKLRPEHLDRTGCTRVLSKVMPELGRLAATMSANEPLQSDEKLAVIKDFYVHGNRDFDVVYRPGEYPVNGLCPDLKCKKDIRRKVERNSHIHDYLQKTASLTWRQNAEYCWECFQFCDQGNYNRHCQVHISSMTKSTGIHYEAITYRSTLMKPAYCIFCLWDDNDNLDAPSRMRSFSRSHDLRRHLETHVIDMKWPGVCPDGSCRKPFNDAQDFRRHLHDIHTYHKSVWQSPASTCNRVGLSKSKSTQSRGQRSPSTTKKLQTPKIIQWQPPANLEDSRISTQSPVTPQPFRHTTVLQLPPDESKAGSTHNSKLQDTGLENPHVTSPPSQHDTPKLDNSSSIPSLSNSTANTPNLLPIDPQILDGEELVETGDHSVQLYPNEGDGRWISNGGAAISVHDEADAHILDEQLSAKQRADCMDVEIYPCPNMEDLPRPSTTSNHKCPSRLPESTVESDNNHRTANLAIKNQKPFTRARAREEAAKNHNKKGRQLKTKSRRGNITEREELFLKKLARETTSEDEVFKAFLDNFPDRSKSFAQRHWVKIEPLPQRMTRSRTKDNEPF